MTLPCRLAALAIIAFVAAPAARAATPISATVARTMQAFDVPGIAVAVVKDDQVVYSKGFGVDALGGGRKVDPHTLFGIASNSKAFVAVAAHHPRSEFARGSFEFFDIRTGLVHQ
ncbi:serine hydrolase [Massilia sp. PWRC2]|uniref:serine hydrolase n=1 Tax=Massilia sp. PWRC2 TaxID=2804626 RepID=UPI003CF971B9